MTRHQRRATNCRLSVRAGDFRNNGTNGRTGCKNIAGVGVCTIVSAGFFWPFLLLLLLLQPTRCYARVELVSLTRTDGVNLSDSEFASEQYTTYSFDETASLN